MNPYLRVADPQPFLILGTPAEISKDGIMLTENKTTIRELTLDEIKLVSGAATNPELKYNYGTGSGGIFSPTGFGAASRFAGGLGLLYT